MTILVTGSAGHLGEALMHRLRGERSPTQGPAMGIDLKPSSFTGHVGSIGDRVALKPVIDAPCPGRTSDAL